MSYAVVRPMRLAVILAKLGKGAQAMQLPGKSEKRQFEANEVAKLAKTS